MRWSSVASFYASDDWDACKARLMLERGGVCEVCGKVLTDSAHTIAHHKTALTPDNVNDVTVSLSLDNLMLVCHECHNNIHERFGGKPPRRVYLVWGSPAAGKTTLVAERAKPEDLIVDMDKLWDAVCLGGHYIKPALVQQEVFALREALFDRIFTRAGKWQTAWVIATLPTHGERTRVAGRLAAETIHVSTNKEECLRRAEGNEQRTTWIEDYWQKFQE